MSKLTINVNKETYELTMIREFNAPRQLVWKAYTKPELTAKWWGPHAFTTTVPEQDVRPGGVWYYIMHGTGEALKGTEFEGMEAGGKAYYQEVKEPELLVYKDVFVDKDGNPIPGMPEALVTIKFEDHGDTTMMTSITKYEKLEDLEKVVEMGVEQGTAETFEKLDTVLAEL